MTHARLGLLGLLATTALVSGCASDAQQAALTGQAINASATAPASVDNFMLVDANLEAHELYRMTDASAVVLVTQANGDAVIRGLAPQLKTLASTYGAKGVQFLLLNSKDSREAILAEAASAGYSAPILVDANQLVGEGLGVTRAAEAFVINPKTWTVAYRGPVSGLSAALDALAAGQPIPAATGSYGAAIAFPDRGSGVKLTYVKDVAPILEKNCVACHQEGGIGPMQLTSYEMVKGFSPMIREVIRTDRMPPYNADPHVGRFSDTKNLTPAEIKKLVHWVEAGAPRGEGADPLAGQKRVAADWPLGKPDLILNIPAYKVPASGVVDYQRPFTENPLTEGKWIRATTVKPGDRQAVHHVLTGWMKDVPKAGQQSSETRWRGSVGGYAVGAESNVFSGEVGTFLPAGGAVGYQMHYTPYGKETVDNTQIGVYFRDDAPKYVMRNVVVIDPTITIQADSKRHKEVAYVEFPNDALLYSAFPHAHYRAYSSDLWLQTPDGKKKLLLSLPRYDFNWQRAYTFAEPIKIPAGSRLIANYVYDNSKTNPANPDSKIKVTWGEQSHEEMLFTSVSFRWLDETAAKQVDSDARFAQTRLIGMMDDNIDGKLQKAELKGQMGNMIAMAFAKIDANGDGGLDRMELAAAQSLLPNRRRQQSDGPNENTPLGGN